MNWFFQKDRKLLSSILPLKSFVPNIMSRQQLYLFMENYIKNTDIIEVTLDPSLPPPQVLYPYENIILTLYSVKILMGSIDEFPAVSQLQFLLRTTQKEKENDHYMFVEIIVNIDEENIARYNNNPTILFSCLNRISKRGYRFYTDDPFMFLKVIQASKEEKQHLYNMMKEDGICIPLSSPFGMKLSKRRLLSLQGYFNHHSFFSYKFSKNIKWKLTKDFEIYTEWVQCENWLMNIKNRMNEHSSFCLTYEPNNLYIKDFISFVPKVKYSDLHVFEGVGLYKEYRFFDDWEYDYEKLFCNVDLKYIDRVYHIRCLKGISTSTGTKYWQYELIARMMGEFYLEIIIAFFENYVLEDRVIFVSKNPHIFMRCIQMGNKKEICDIMIQDEGLCTLNNNNNLISRCASEFVKHIIKSRKVFNKMEWIAAAQEEIQNNSSIPFHLKSQLITEGQQVLISKYWERGVKDATTHHQLLNKEFRYRDDFDIEEFRTSPNISYDYFCKINGI